jgi:FXSXX-COOH protein
MLFVTLGRDASDQGVDMEQQEAVLPSTLPNISGLMLHDLDGLDGSVFASAMRALLDPERRDSEAIAGFGSRIKAYETD